MIGVNGLPTLLHGFWCLICCTIELNWIEIAIEITIEIIITHIQNVVQSNYNELLAWWIYKLINTA